MKKNFFALILSFICLVSSAQIKMHATGHVSFQSTTYVGGVQIDSLGKTSFEPNLTGSGVSLTQTKVQSPLVRAWNVKYIGDPTIMPNNLFYVTGLGEAYAQAHYVINPQLGGERGALPIENASEMLSRLNGYYFDNHALDGFEPDFVDNPNIAPEAVAGMMRDLAIDKSLGLFAADLEAVLPEAIRHDPEGMVYINYSAIVPVLVEAFKEQQRTIELLQKEIADLKNGRKEMCGIEKQEENRNILYQNTPNPTNSSTTIECSIDSRFSKASVAVYDLNGTQIKECPVYHQGRNTVTVEANEFKPGIYMYSLLVDGKLIDTKRMVITSK